MIHTNEYLPGCLATGPLQAMEPDSDTEAIADAVISASVLRDECDGNVAFKKSARQLLYTCLGYLCNWYSLERRTVGNLKALLDAVHFSAPGSAATDLGSPFYEIEPGCKCIINADGITTNQGPATLEHNDGTYPRDTNDIHPEDDLCLGCYKRFTQGTAPTIRASIAVSLSHTLPEHEDQEGGSFIAQGKENPEINKKVTTSALVTLSVSVVGFYLGNRCWEAVVSLGGQSPEHWGDGFTLMWPLITDTPTHLDMFPNAMLAGLTMCIIVWFFRPRYLAFVGNSHAGGESGLARWGMLKEGKQFRDLTTEDSNLISTQDFGLVLHRPKFNPEFDHNLSVLVVGGSSSGKTFNYVTPNICQLNTSYLITDPKGTPLKDAGFLFMDNGYKAKSFNTINLDEPMHYSPLKYVKTDVDTLFFINCYIMSTDGDGKTGDPFWENSGKILYTSLTAFLHGWFPPEDYNLPNLLTLLPMAEARGNDESFKSPLDLLFLQIEEGKRYIPSEGGAPAPPMGVSDLSRSFGTGSATGDPDWSWEPINLKRNSDGVRPADYGGLPPDEDLTLMSYKNFEITADDICSKWPLNHDFAMVSEAVTQSIFVSGGITMRDGKITLLYECLSRDDELQGENNPISNQKQMLEDSARRNGLPNPMHFTNDGISGTRFDHPGFLAMMKEVETGHVEAVVIKDMSWSGHDYLRVGQAMEVLRQ